MASVQFLLVSMLVVAATNAAPQLLQDGSQPPIPHEFSYGVSVPETGDVKEHKQAVSQTGRTDGEYRWLQPNGLYRVVRYFVDGDSGFVAEVSEEPGADVANYYRNSFTLENADGAVALGPGQGFAKSFDSSPSQQSNLGAAVNVINAPRPNRNRQPVNAFGPTSFSVQPQQQRFSSQQQQQQQQQSFSSQQSFNSQSFSGNVIDGGIIDGGIIDGGIIDGGIIDGGIINADEFANFQNFDDNDSLEDTPVVLARGSRRFQG